jgi:hypothetical protein
MSQRVDRLTAGAEVGTDALARLAVDSLAFDKLSDEHAPVFAVAVAADPLDIHASWIPENGRRHFGQYNITRMGEALWVGLIETDRLRAVAGPSNRDCRFCSGASAIVIVVPTSRHPVDVHDPYR